MLGAYRFTTYRSKPNGAALEDVQVVDPAAKAGAAAKRAVADGGRIAEAVCLARDLVNEPGGVLTAPEFARRAALATANGVSCTVHDERAVAGSASVGCSP